MTKFLDFAPMESLGSAVFRRAHARLFGGVDRYFIAFITPTRDPPFTARQLREIAPEANVGFVAVPQLLTRRAEDFIWAVHALADLGYREVNFNLGCPAGTVTAKGKGAGFLRSPDELERFFASVFEKPLPISVSVKTRLGWANTAEFERLADVFNHFPFASVTIHARLKTDLYRGHARLAAFREALKRLHHPVIYNGDIVTKNDALCVTQRFPDLTGIMVGRGLIADPALFRKLRGGEPACSQEIDRFTQDLFEGYCRAWNNRKNALMRMKEYWFLLANLFGGDSQVCFKAICRAKTESDYTAAVRSLLSQEMLPQARMGWYKPLSEQDQ